MLRIVAGSNLLITLLLVASPALAGDEIELRYKMAKGEPLIYRSETSLKQTQTVNGMKVETEIKNNDVALRTLEKIDEKGNLRIRTENKQFRVNMKVGPLGEYVYDSKSEKHDEGGPLSTALNPIYDRLKTAALSFTLTPRGELTALEGMKELLEDVLKDNPIGTQFTGGGSDKVAQMGMAEMFAVFGEKPVKPGDTWEAKYELDLPKLGKAEGKRIYTFEGFDKVQDRKTARIRVSHELSFDVDLETGGAKVKGKMKIDQSSGVIQFDPDKGRIVSMDSTYQISGDLNVDAGGKLIPVKSEQTQSVKVELLDKLPE